MEKEISAAKSVSEIKIELSDLKARAYDYLIINSQLQAQINANNQAINTINVRINELAVEINKVEKKK